MNKKHSGAYSKRIIVFDSPYLNYIGSICESYILILANLLKLFLLSWSNYIHWNLIIVHGIKGNIVFLIILT